MKQHTTFLLKVALGGLLTFGIASAALAQNTGGDGTNTLPPPSTPPRNNIGGEVRAIQVQKRQDVAGIRASSTMEMQGMRKDAHEAIVHERTDMRAAVKNARADGTTTPEERMGLRDKRDQMQQDIKDIRRAAISAATSTREKMRLEISDRREEARGDIMKAVMERNMRLASSSEKMMRMGSTSPKMRMGSSTDAERAARAVEQAAKFAQQAVDRMSAAIERFNTLVTRLQSRIDKVAAAGGDTTAAKAALAEAVSKISAAKDGITNVSSAFAEVATLPNPKDGASKIESAMKAQQALMKAAQDALMRVVTTLQGQKGADTPATPVTETPSTEANTN